MLFALAERIRKLFYRGHINGDYISPRDSEELGFITSWSVERIKSFYLLLSTVFICLSQRIKRKQRSSTHSDLQTADDIKRDCSEQEGIPGCAALSCYDPPGSTLQPQSPATTYLASLWGLLSLPSEHVPCYTKWESLQAPFSYFALSGHLSSHGHLQQGGRANRDHTKLCSIVHAVARTSCSPACPWLQAYAKYL